MGGKSYTACVCTPALSKQIHVTIDANVEDVDREAVKRMQLWIVAHAYAPTRACEYVRIHVCKCLCTVVPASVHVCMCAWQETSVRICLPVCRAQLSLLRCCQEALLSYEHTD